jgi:flagellar export protein FliJ
MAGPFRFRLETVLRVRTQQRDARRRALAEALRNLHTVQRRIDEADQAMRMEVDRTRETRGVARLDVAALRGQQLYMARLHRQIHEGRLALAEKRKIVEQERERLAEASKRLKAIEKLRERCWQRYQLQELRAERARVDEVAAQGFLRRRAEGIREGSV